MRPIPAAVLSVPLLLGLIRAAGAEPLHLRGDDWAKIDKGEIVVHIGANQNGVRLYQVMGLLDAPADRVWKLLMDFEHYTSIFGVVTKSTIIKRVSDRRLHHYESFALPWPINSRWFVNEITLEPEKLAYSWTNLDGNVKEQRGSFSVIPRNNKAMLAYQLFFDPDVPWFPKFLLNIGQRITLPSAIKDARKAIARY